MAFYSVELNIIGVMTFFLIELIRLVVLYDYIDIRLIHWKIHCFRAIKVPKNNLNDFYSN